MGDNLVAAAVDVRATLEAQPAIEHPCPALHWVSLAPVAGEQIAGPPPPGQVVNDNHGAHVATVVRPSPCLNTKGLDRRDAKEALLCGAVHHLLGPKYHGAARDSRQGGGQGIQLYFVADYSKGRDIIEHGFERAGIGSVELCAYPGSIIDGLSLTSVNIGVEVPDALIAKDPSPATHVPGLPDEEYLVPAVTWARYLTRKWTQPLDHIDVVDS